MTLPPSQNIEQAIEQIIEQSNNLLIAFSGFSIEDEQHLAAIIEQSSQRHLLLTNLFSNHSQQDLALFPDMLSEIAKLDQQLLTQASKLKSVIAKQVIKQKKNTKATNAYLNK